MNAFVKSQIFGNIAALMPPTAVCVIDLVVAFDSVDSVGATLVDDDKWQRAQ